MTHLYYIAGGEGLCGIYVKQFKNTTSLKDGMYYVHPDHLGSLALITDGVWQDDALGYFGFEGKYDPVQNISGFNLIRLLMMR